MVNEVLCKILAHNLCCLIQEQCELGIETEFWPEEMAKMVPAPLIDVEPLPVAEFDFAGRPGRRKERPPKPPAIYPGARDAQEKSGAAR
jgi:hypothetical protein